MILDRLADATRARYARRMADTPLDIVKSRALALPKGCLLYTSIRSNAVRMVFSIFSENTTVPGSVNSNRYKSRSSSITR